MAVLGLLLDLLAMQVAFRLGFELFRRLHPALGRSLLGRDIRTPFEIPAMGLAVIVGAALLLPWLRRFVAGEGLAASGLAAPRERRAWGGAAVALGVSMLVAGSMLLAAPRLVMEAFEGLGMRDRDDLLLFVLVVAPIYAALMEELIYRGVIQGVASRVDRAWGPLAAMLAFALIHLYQGWVAMIVSVLPVSLVFTLQRRRFPSIWPLVLGHLVIDLLLFVGIFEAREQPEAQLWIGTGGLCLGLALLFGSRRVGRELWAELGIWAREFSWAGARRHLPWTLVLVACVTPQQMLIGHLGLPLVIALAIVLAAVAVLRRRRNARPDPDRA